MEGIRSTGGGFVTYIRQIIGTYTPLTDSSGDPVTTLAGVDWEYIVQAVILLMTLYFFFKFLTLAFKR